MQTGFGRLKVAPLVAVSLLAFARGTSAGDLPQQFSGNLLGEVLDSLGTPQMGASVFLFDRYERLIRSTLTLADGRFGFASLPPSVYAVKISVPSLIPASREKISVRAGLSSVLRIRMASLLSTVEVKYTAPTSAMSDDWKWVLRASTATRVITRDLPGNGGKSSSTEEPQKAFTDTRARLSLSAGDAGSLLSDSSLADLGTSFALATTLYGRNQLTLSGAFGQSLASGMPTMGARVTYARADSDGLTSMPEITVTAQQISLPNRLMGYSGSDANPAVRSTSVSYYDTMDLLGFVHMEYGTSLDSVSYFDHLSRASPFGRVTANLGKAGSLAMAYSNGGSPKELYIHQFGEDSDLAGTIGALSAVPSFSMRGGHLQLQRTQNYEIGYSKLAGHRAFSVSGFYENVNDGRLNVAGDLSGLDTGNLLPDVSTTTTIYNLGHYNRNGVMAAMDQKVSDNLEVGIAAGSMGGFTAPDLTSDHTTLLQRKNHLVASANVRTTLPLLQTRITGNYEFVNDDAIIPRHIFSTQRLYAEPGLNIIVRQPLPSFFGIGKLELSADLRNLLAQGYLPLAMGDGHHMLLVQAPRAVRGGLNIIF